MRTSKTNELTEPVELELPTLTPVPAALLPSETLTLSDSATMGLDLVLFGTTVSEAAKHSGLDPGTLYKIVHSEPGRRYMALQRATMETWLAGLMYQAATVLKNELTNKSANIRMRAAESILKYLGNRSGADSTNPNAVDATDVVRALMKAMNINLNIKVNDGTGVPTLIQGN